MQIFASFTFLFLLSLSTLSNGSGKDLRNKLIESGLVEGGRGNLWKS